MKLINIIIIQLIIAFGLFQPAKAQNVSISGEIFEYATYYVNSFDLNTGATNVQMAQLMYKYFAIN